MEATSDPLTRLQAVTELERSDGPLRRMLIIVNPYASTVSDRLRNLVVYALRGRYEVHAVDTESRDHATILCREAAAEGYDVVVAFGGDGTFNEAANGLAGSDTPLCCLPGGRANVWCRIIGMPIDIVDATEHLLAMAHDWQPRRVDVGRVNDRLFLVLRRRRTGRERGRAGRRPPAAETAPRRVVLHVVGDQHLQPALPRSPPASRGRPGRGDRRRSDDDGAERDPPTPISASVRCRWPRARRCPAVTCRRSSCGARASPTCRRSSCVRSLDVCGSPATAGSRASPACGRSSSPPPTSAPLPLQVDGDFIGEFAQARFEAVPDGLLIIS